MAITTSVRNVGVSLVIVTGSFPGTAAITSATAYALFQTIVMVLVALAWGRLTPAGNASVNHEGCMNKKPPMSSFGVAPKQARVAGNGSGPIGRVESCRDKGLVWSRLLGRSTSRDFAESLERNQLDAIAGDKSVVLRTTG